MRSFFRRVAIRSAICWTKWQPIEASRVDASSFAISPKKICIPGTIVADVEDEEDVEEEDEDEDEEDEDEDEDEDEEEEDEQEDDGEDWTLERVRFWFLGEGEKEGEGTKASCEGEFKV